MAQQQKVPVLRRPEFRVSLVISILVALTTAITLMIFLVNRSLFSKNPHFVLNHVIVNSSGYWQSNENEMLKLLKLEKGRSNLFGIEPRALVKKLGEEPNIEKATVARILPDTLRIDISERIPRAIVRDGPSKTTWAVDSEGRLMDSSRIPPLKGLMPVIVGVRLQEPGPGKAFKELKEPLKIVALSLTTYTDLKIITINLGVPDEIRVYFNYKNSKILIPAYFPSKNVEEKLKALNLFFISNPAADIRDRILDLRFKDMLISAAKEEQQQ